MSGNVSCYEKDAGHIRDELMGTEVDDDFKAGLIALAGIVDGLAAQKKIVEAEPSASDNTDYVTALWKELHKCNSGLVPLKTDWVPVTKRRLNSAMKRLNIT